MEPVSLFSLYFNLIIALIWFMSLVIALLGIRKQDFSGLERVLWALIVVFVPFIGAIAYFLLGARKQS